MTSDSFEEVEENVWVGSLWAGQLFKRVSECRRLVQGIYFTYSLHKIHTVLCVFSTVGNILTAVGGYHDKCGGNEHPHTRIMTSLHGTEQGNAGTHMYHDILPRYLTSPKELKISHTVRKISPNGNEHSLQYSRYPPLASF